MSAVGPRTFYMAKECGELLRTKAEVEWNIPNFFEVTECVRSPFFSFRGASLYIELFPKGRKKSRGHISIYLSRKGKGSPRTLTFRLFLKSADGTLIDLFQDTHALPDGGYNGWGNKKAFLISELREKREELVPCDVLTVVCFISIYPEPVPSESEWLPPERTLSECSEDGPSASEWWSRPGAAALEFGEDGPSASEWWSRPGAAALEFGVYPEPVPSESEWLPPERTLSECSEAQIRGTDPGYESFVEATTQTQSEYLHPESIKESENILEATNETHSPNCFDKLSSDLNGLLASGEDSDMVVLVKGTEFRLHRGIMGARTPVFHSMFRNEMREKSTGTVSIEDCDADAFRAFVYYVYSGRVDQMCTDTVFDLFVLADKYQTDELKSACLDFVRGSLSVDTFCEVVTLAVTFDEKELLKQATVFLAGNMTEVMQTVKWMNFLRDHHIEANELMLKAVSMKK